MDPHGHCGQAAPTIGRFAAKPYWDEFAAAAGAFAPCAFCRPCARATLAPAIASAANNKIEDPALRYFPTIVLLPLSRNVTLSPFCYSHSFRWADVCRSVIPRQPT